MAEGEETAKSLLAELHTSRKCFIETMEYCSVLTNNILVYAATQMKPEDMKVSEQIPMREDR